MCRKIQRMGSARNPSHEVEIDFGVVATTSSHDMISPRAWILLLMHPGVAATTSCQRGDRGDLHGARIDSFPLTQPETCASIPQPCASALTEQMPSALCQFLALHNPTSSAVPDRLPFSNDTTRTLLSGKHRATFGSRITSRLPAQQKPTLRPKFRRAVLRIPRTWI